MALQGSDLAVAGLGLASDIPGTPEQPPVQRGVHLRIATSRQRGFPWYGFYLYRRASGPGAPERFDVASLGSVPGPLAGPVLDTAQGAWSSDENLVLTDVEPPAGSLEIDLSGRTFLRFDRPVGLRIRRAEVRVAFRQQPDEPAPVTGSVDFTGREPGSGPNPRTENGVVFLARNAGGQPLHRSRIERRRVGSEWISGLDADDGGLDITLPVPATHVEVTVTRSHRGSHGGDHDADHHDHHPSNVTVTAVEQDGTSTSTVLGHAAQPVTETVQLLGQAIGKVTVRPSRPDGPEVLLNVFAFGTARISRLDLVAMDQDVPVATTGLVGYAGLVVTGSVEFDAFTALRIGGGAAAVVDLSWVPLDVDTTAGWEPLPGLAGPLRLPVTHPDYPCTPGATPSLSAARALARDRIHYGDPDAYTATPSPTPGLGTVTVTAGSPTVTGTGTTWDATTAGALFAVPGHDDAYGVVRVVDAGTLVLSRPFTGPSGTSLPYTLDEDPFAHLHDQLMVLVSGGPAGGAMAERTLPVPTEHAGTVAVIQGSPVVEGTGTSWGTHLRGLVFAVGGDPTWYTVVDVASATSLTLDHPYTAGSAIGVGYAVTVPIQAAQGGAPATPILRPLDLLSLASVDPAVAQMLGLYVLDGSAAEDQSYDYLVMSDSTGVGGLDPVQLLATIRESGFGDVDAYIVHNQGLGTPPPLPAPEGLRLYALPGVNRAGGPAGQDTSNAVGLRWSLNRTDQEVLIPGSAICYHLWRADLGDGAAPADGGSYLLLTGDRPIIPQIAPTTGASPPDQPPFPLHAVDPALPEGWYGYQVNGVDIFGRHSPPSEPGAWWQWAPVPQPRPWYYQDPPGDRQLHPSAIQLLVKTAPPAPPGVQAWALDPADPLLVKDGAYQSWWSALTASPWYQDLPEEERYDLIGLRVRWRWTPREQAQAPESREFRIYLQPEVANTLLGQVSGATPGDPGETLVVTDIDSAAPAGGFAGGTLLIDSVAFPILDSDATSPLTLRVRNSGIDREIPPAAPAGCSVLVPRSVTAGSIALTPGSDLVDGQRTAWNATLAGARFRIPPQADTYTVVDVLTANRLRLDRPYHGSPATDRRYAIDHPLWIDMARPINWQSRYHVVDVDENWTTVTGQDGTAVRQYEIFLPDPAGPVHQGLPLRPTAAEPVVYAQIGVSAADRRPHTPDDPRWDAGNWGGRSGNEGPVGAPAGVFRVRREPPAPPLMPAYPVDHLLAAAADAGGQSVHSVRWLPVPGLRVHVGRALDDAVFQADWPHRPRPALDPSQLDAFPDEAREPRWDAQRRGEVADVLNGLNALARDGTDTPLPVEAYAALTDDAVRVLAALPGNETAFTPVSTAPLDPDDPDRVDARGPDDADAYLSDPALRRYATALDGRTPGRYLIRLRHVDAAHNQSAFGYPAPPVHTPDLRPPAPPDLLRAGAAAADSGDRTIAVEWVHHGRTDTLSWEVWFRPASEPEGSWQSAGVVPAGTQPDASGRYRFLHGQRIPGIAYAYEVVASRLAEVPPNGSTRNLSSLPSASRTAVAISRTPLAAPVDVSAAAIGAGQVRIAWTNGDAYQSLTVWRRPATGQFYRRVGQPLPAGATEFVDTQAATGEWRYQIRAAGVRREARSIDAEVTVP